jgi:endonuclease/exonuclease/phosphatase family metal-dependent hydrolase
MTLPVRRALRGLLALPLLAAFAFAGPTGALASPGSRPVLERPVTVMTRNLYLGADLTGVLGAHTAEAAFGALATVAGNVELNQPPVRMAAVAAEIAAADPDVVALQEVADWNIVGKNPLTGGQVLPPARYDFLALLQQSLIALHEPYRVAAVQRNFDSAVQLPPAVAQLATFADRDVILVRGPNAVMDRQQGHFTAQLKIPVAALGAEVNFLRGYQWVDLRSRGALWRVVNTHPEAYSPAGLGLPGGDVNGAELTELRSKLVGVELPIAILGDLNSAYGETARAGYSALVAGGFTDTWLSLGNSNGDSTCCRDEMLTGGSLTERIDHVLVRGAVTPLAASQVGVAAFRTSPAPLWASDHAGVVTSVSVTKQEQ